MEEGEDFFRPRRYSTASVISAISSIGDYHFKEDRITDLSDPNYDSPPLIQFAGVNASVRARNGESKIILQNLYGETQASEMVAILGASGSGKTTLLKMLAGKSSINSKNWTMNGSLTVNNHPIPLGTPLEPISFVEQEDVLLSSLTVEETLTFYARLSLPYSTTKSEIKETVDDLISDLNLATIRKSKISVISGGEKRRISIACQIVRNPRVIILDEPTSGLSSADAFDLIVLLKFLAKSQKKGIIVSLHQPSKDIYDLFDRINLIKEGYTIFFGYRNSVLEFFSDHGHKCPPDFNPADFLLDTIFEIPTEKLLSYCEPPSFDTHSRTSSILAITDNEPDLSHSLFYSTWILFLRNSRFSFRHSSTLVSMFAVAFILSFLIAWMFANIDKNSIQDRFSLAYVIGLTAWGIIIPTVDQTYELSSVFYKEREQHLYGNVPYIINCTIVIVTRLVLGTLLFTFPVYFIVGLPADRFLNVFFGIYLYALVVDCVIHFVAHSQRFGSDYPLQLATVFIVISHYVAGFYIVHIHPVVSWIKTISISRYSFECVLVSFFKGYTLDGVDGTTYLIENNYHTSQEYYYGILFIFVVVFYVLWILSVVFHFHEITKDVFKVLTKSSKQSTVTQSPKYEKIILPRDPTTTDIMCRWENLSISAKRKKKLFSQPEPPLEIVNENFGFVQCGKMLAIIGASGSGKSTLLNTLFQRINEKQYQITGDIFFNGVKAENIKGLRQVIGFVQQDEEFLNSLSIDRTLTYIANLGLSHLPAEQIRERKEKVIQAFGLEHISHSPIKNISGGEKKRLSIASEVMLGRGIIALDEPTTGLSAKESLYVIEALKDLSKQKIAIVASIHQPRSDVLKLFDYVLVLGKGSTVYFGKRKDMMPYFLRLIDQEQTINSDEVNQEEFVSRLVQVYQRRDNLKDLVSLYNTSDIHSKMKKKLLKLETKETSGISERKFNFLLSIKQFWTLYQRLVIAMFLANSDRIRMVLPSFVMFIEILAAYQLPLYTTYARDRMGSIASPLVLFLMWSTTITVTAIQGFEVFKREFNKGLYSTEIFFFSSQLAHMTQDTLLSILCCGVVYWTLGLYASASNFFLFLLFNALTYLMWIQICLLMVPILKSFGASVGLVGALDFFCVWTSGYWVSIQDMPGGIKQFHYINPVGAALEALISNELNHVSFTDPDTGAIVPGSYYLDQLQFTSTILSRFFMVFFYYLGFIVLRFITLKLANKKL